MRPEVKKDFDDIVDCLTAADGGISFIMLRAFLDTFDTKAENGDKDAEQIVLIMRRFANVVRFAQK
jgi:hypothetical protein